MKDFDNKGKVRFLGIERLYGEDGAARIHAAHIAVVGVGGVGSWVVEALARSGVGRLTLIDMDDVCESNFNRQIHATGDVIGRPKVEVMAERVLSIHPECEVAARVQYFTASTVADLFGQADFDCVVDAIDSLRNKILLIKTCRERGIPLIVSGGAGGKSDPTRIRLADLSRTENDPLLQKLRKELRRKHGFPRDIRRKFGVISVFSDEVVTLQEPEEGCPAGGAKLDCESGYGTACPVTGAFGFVAASWVLRTLSANRIEASNRQPQGNRSEGDR